MALGQVLGHGGKTPFMGAAHVAGNPVATVQGLDRMRGDAQLQGQADQGVGHAVAVALKLDMAVDVHAHRLEDRPFPGLHRQGDQGRGVNLGKYAGTAAGQLLKRALVEPLQQGLNGVVDLLHAGKLEFTQARQYPALDQC
jgi:hypothetical protein